MRAPGQGYDTGDLDGAGMHMMVLCSRFNRSISERLLAGALDCLRRHGVADETVDVLWVPGAFELPLAALSAARTGRYDAVITLGSVIRGGTSHYELVCNETASGVARASLDSGVPVIFGVLTTETVDQALERSRSDATNKGHESAVAAIEMACVVSRMAARPASC